jgi:hypothetical protein
MNILDIFSTLDPSIGGNFYLDRRIKQSISNPFKYRLLTSYQNHSYSGEIFMKITSLHEIERELMKRFFEEHWGS